MMPRALAERANDLRAHGEPFVTATVVRVQRPTSAQAGNVALVRNDGTIEGFVGGVCAQHSVRLYSLKAIQTGEPLLLRITPEGPDGSDGPGEADPNTTRLIADDSDLALSGHEIAREKGTVTVRNPCLSGGALELFLEPVLPAPRVLVVGDSPIVGALKVLGPELGLELVAGVDRIDGRVAPRAGDLALIVAAHGRDEVQALQAGLAAEIPYVGLVASPKRGAAVVDDLRAEGVAEDQVARVDSPAGLDIGARTPAEIALSILAEVVTVRRRRGDPVAASAAAGETLNVIAPTAARGGARTGESGTPARAGGDLPDDAGGPAIVVDPICGMTVVVVAGTPSAQAGDTMAYFCCEACKLAFERQHQAA
jgi:xanthine dehydrogenase accessory factor